MTILEKIKLHKKTAVAKAKQAVSLKKLQQSKYYNRKCFSLYEYIERGNGVIAEFKRQSPSKGIINDQAKVQDVVLGYKRAGVSAVSVLTDTPFFGGTNQDLIVARESINIPILRKDFIISSYQIHEAKAIGADAILLIAAILTQEEIITFTDLAHYLGLEVLFEIYNEQELRLHIPEIRIVGINNRNLNTFEVDFENAIKLSRKLPKNTLKIAESGISDPNNIKMLRSKGFDGFLIGENFMKTTNPVLACHEFIKKI